MLVANTAYGLSVARHHYLLRVIRRHAAVGTRLPRLDPWPDESRTALAPAPLVSGELLVMYGGG